MLKNSDISVVIQGSTKGIFNNKRCVDLCVESIHKVLPKCKIILSTWEGEEVPLNLKVDKIIYNKDPGFKTRDGKPNGKPNNVNRQLVSTLAGLKSVETKYALKLRTDFILKNKNFIKQFGKYNKSEQDYTLFDKKIMCAMFGTAKPYGKYWDLPFHVSDFTTFGLTTDLIRLYDIPLVTNEEFEYFLIHTEFMPRTFARNRYNAEQSIWIGCLRKNGFNVPCEYSTHVNEEIASLSERYLANNFCPMPFKQLGIVPLKLELKARNKIKYYTEYYTPAEWENLYYKYCLKKERFNKFDIDRLIVNWAIYLEEKTKLQSLKRRLVNWRF